MRVPRLNALSFRGLYLIGVILLLSHATAVVSQEAQSPKNAPDYGSTSQPTDCDTLGSPFIPVDSWMYQEMSRLYSLGFVNHVYFDLRPWTRASLRNILNDTHVLIENSNEGPITDQAREIYEALNRELNRGAQGECGGPSSGVFFESAYSVARAISGPSLRDSFHLGSTIVNDYGRPYEKGFNYYSGVSGYATAGRFTLYVRGELQGVPSSVGYSPALYQTLAAVDLTINPVTGIAYPNQATIPLGPRDSAARWNFLEAYVSTQVLNHVISFGKVDEWLGPAQGASMAYSNNAENIYAFHINRIEPLQIPLLSRLTGPFRYEFLVGPLRGHELMPNPNFTGDTSTEANVLNPGNPWIHVEKISFQPTKNLEFGFERTAFFGGKGHSPVTIHTFLKSFLSTVNVGLAEKDGRNDPGARFAAFNFSYRLPLLRNWVTLYTDSEVHDDVSPIDAPQNASIRPGIFLSHVPALPRLDIRAEGISSDPPSFRSVGGQYMYWEYLERQGYTNHGQMFGDWIGREGKGGQAWITYHLSGNEWLQAEWRHQKASKDFIPGGTTLNDFSVQAVKRLGADLELDGTFSLERWKAPIYMPGLQTVTNTTIKLTWFPKYRAHK